jgi:hypothetical protein
MKSRLAVLSILLIIMLVIVGCKDGGGGDDDDNGDDAQDTVACTTTTAIAPNGTVNGTLSETDCTVAELTGDDDDSFFDLYEVTLPQDGTLTVRLESTEFDAFLSFADIAALDDPEDPQVPVFEDDDGAGGTDALIVLKLVAGTYVIVVNSYDEDETGTYTLTTTFE